MTRDEFIDGYLKRSGREKYRTPDGYQTGKHRRVALPCACGDKRCEGWAMIPADAESVADHMRLYAPEPPSVIIEPGVTLYITDIANFSGKY